MVLADEQPNEFSPLLVANRRGNDYVSFNGIGGLGEERPPLPQVFKVVGNAGWMEVLQIAPELKIVENDLNRAVRNIRKGRVRLQQVLENKQSY